MITDVTNEAATDTPKGTKKSGHVGSISVYMDRNFAYVEEKSVYVDLMGEKQQIELEQ